MIFTNFIKIFYKNEKDLKLLKFSRHISYIILHYLKQKSKSDASNLLRWDPKIHHRNSLIQYHAQPLKTIYITFKDRLSRFGFNYFKNIFSYFGTNIIVLDDKEETNKTYQQELMEDLLSIIHTYSMKLYTNRKKKIKEIEKIIKENDNFSE